MEPTKSGVVGLLAAASGIPRDDDDAVAELASLRLGVRVDREGILERDYHTTQNVPITTGKARRTVVSQRHYLASALFLVVVSGAKPLIDRLATAVDHPQWPLFFGRRAFVPARPLQPTVRDASIERVLAGHRWLEQSVAQRRAELDDPARAGLRTVVDCAPTEARAEPRHDHPVSFAHGRRHHVSRSVLVGSVPLTPEMLHSGDDPCT